MPTTKYVRALENRVTQDPLPRCSVAVHSFLRFHENTTDPVGVPDRDLTVADSFTALPVRAREGLADTVVVVGCLVATCAEAVAALAGSANIAQGAVTTAGADPSLTGPAPARWPRDLVSSCVGA